MTPRNLLRTLVPLLLLVLSSAASQGECPEGRAYSQDLGKCMECSVCKNSEKSDFCQNCPSKTEQPDFPWIWVIGFSAGGVFLIIVILSLTVYLTHCRRKSKFTTPIEETGSHSAEALLIH
uniref:Fn14 protein n=1 Tax=Xenopus laevis TaxID=8355 RepID=B7ZQA3_XENLA|nr:Fn14 protein [Xenopus laevis]AAI69737.1 Fn14 protein [Xenopus laevis]